MENLRLYRIEGKYIRFLKSRDPRVQDNKDRRRPYVGVVLNVSSYQYFVPMESPKPNHAKMKSGKHFLRIDGGRLGILGFNNMIPIHQSALINFDINKETDQKYAALLKHQIAWINKHKADVLNHASKTYFAASKNNAFLSKICCDFKKLEKACSQYNPNYSKKN